MPTADCGWCGAGRCRPPVGASGWSTHGAASSAPSRVGGRPSYRPKNTCTNTGGCARQYKVLYGKVYWYFVPSRNAKCCMVLCTSDGPNYDHIKPIIGTGQSYWWHGSTYSSSSTSTRASQQYWGKIIRGSEMDQDCDIARWVAAGAAHTGGHLQYLRHERWLRNHRELGLYACGAAASRADRGAAPWPGGGADALHAPLKPCEGRHRGGDLLGI